MVQSESFQKKTRQDKKNVENKQKKTMKTQYKYSPKPDT